jgi:2,6-dihydroxypseudooxynicotine hydrolase
MTAKPPQDRNGPGEGGALPPRTSVRTGRLEVLVPHLIRGQLLRPGFVRMSLKLGVARQMPAWAKLQFLNAGVDADDLEHVLGRITSLETWADEWERLAQEHEKQARQAQTAGDHARAADYFLRASAAYNFSQYVIFMDMKRKRVLHDACVRSYEAGAPWFDPPAERIEVRFRRRAMVGWFRRPRGAHGPTPVVVMFNGTNAVKEELHWWSNAMLDRGIATIAFDGPGMGQTFHRLSMVAEPRPVGVAILNHIETRPELQPGAVAFMGMSLGGYCAIRMAAHDPRIRAVAAVSPPFSADVYWRVTLAGMRRELAALYGIEEREMEASIDRITLANDLPGLGCPLLVAGGEQDHITPGSEAWRIFGTARCARELVFYPGGGHDCFNVMSDLRPRIVSWMVRQLEPRRMERRQYTREGEGPEPDWGAASAVDPDFADALRGEATANHWERGRDQGVPVRWEWPWAHASPGRVEVVHRVAPAERPSSPWIVSG